MAELPLTQIKVDRAVLSHPLAEQELALVVRIARHALDLGHADSPRAVIVEGFDEQSPITLKQIYDQRIRHVQGYISQDRPGPTIRKQLNADIREHIAA